MKLIPVIGLETHVQLKTRTKLFCSCATNSDNAPVNTNVCAICLGHPGTLPVLNEEALRFAVMLATALNGNVAPHSKFDRKHYFYPDLPKAYQISQFDLPVMTEGYVDLDLLDAKGTPRIGLERMHLEEDAAKNIHGDDGKTYVDFNRAGTPLCEIVTRPDFRSAVEAKAYLQELRLLVRTLGISDGDMEKGQLRCDVNISLREADDDGNFTGPLNTKTEIKNINSFRHVERAIAYEIQRQTKLWDAGTPPTATTTRGWNDTAQRTDEQRTKEDAADYRFFPEPDIPPLDLSPIVADVRARMPELPAAKRARFADEYGMKREDVRQIIDDPNLANFAEAALSELGAWLEAQPDVTSETVDAEKKKLMKLFTSWLLNKLPGLLTERGSDIRVAKLTPENFAEFVVMLSTGRLTGPKGLEVLARMLDDGADPEHAMTEMGAKRVDDVVALRTIIDSVLAENPDEASRYKAGEKKLAAFLLGQIMKATQGNADPSLAAKVLNEALQ